MEQEFSNAGSEHAEDTDEGDGEEFGEGGKTVHVRVVWNLSPFRSVLAAGSGVDG
jgi:hypothetical protein